MKLSVCLLLAVVAAASADQGFYQQQQQYAVAPQSAPSGYVNGNYYDQQPPARRNWFDGLFGSNRRQGIAGILAGIGPIGAVVGVVVVVVVVAVVGVVATQLSSSGRGFDDDEWEVDHSVWMDQLQKDFESSWSQE